MATPSPPSRRPLILLCGDSLTQDAAMPTTLGWGLLLQHAFVRSADVINRGLCGYNTAFFVEYALPVIREELRTVFRPALITVWLGANDAALVDGSEPELHVPINNYRENLARILKELQQHAPQAKLLLITPPVVDDDHRRRIQVEEQGKSPSDPIDRTNEQAGAYATAAREVAAQADGVALLDMHAFFMTQYPDATDRAPFLSDGLHFTTEGNRVVFEQVKRKIETLLPEETLETWQLPCFTTLIQGNNKGIAREGSRTALVASVYKCMGHLGGAKD